MHELDAHRDVHISPVNARIHHLCPLPDNVTTTVAANLNSIGSVPISINEPRTRLYYIIKLVMSPQPRPSNSAFEWSPHRLSLHLCMTPSSMIRSQ